MYSTKNKSRLKLVYIIVFLSLALWAIFAYYTMNELIKSQEGYANIINISGKQRMLSQKTTLMAKRSFETKDKKLISHTIELITLMKNDHDFLISNLSSSHMEDIYFSQKYNLDKKVKKYFLLFENFLKDMNKKNLQKIEEYSFTLLPNLNYAVYEFEKESNNKTKELRKREFFILIGTLLTLILEALIIVIPSIKLNEKNEQDLKDINESLKNKVNEKVKKLREKDIIIHEQSKMISMREVLNNIAHQWRQPLSIITTSASGLKLQKEYDQLTDEDFEKELDLILENGEYLSKTIDTFRNFFEEDKDNIIYTFQDIYDNSIKAIKHKIEEKNITLDTQIQKIEYQGNRNKLMNIITEIYNNSIYELEKIDKDRFIITKIYVEKNKIKIEILDNAGGIPKKYIDKIFEPYFTTKHKSMGKGMNLFITKESIEKTLKGEISVKNLEYKYKDEIEVGALFSIILPLK